MHSRGFLEKVKETWNERGLEGWGSYIVKENLMSVKEALKNWNQDHFGHIDQKIMELRKELKTLDEKDDTRGLEEGEAIRRNEVAAQLLLNLKNKKSLLTQKAKLG